MSIYAEKRQGKPTGLFVVEVVKHGERLRRRVTTMKQARQIEAMLSSGTFVPKAQEAKPSLTTLAASLEARTLWKGTKDEHQSLARLEASVGLLGATVPIAEIGPHHVDHMVDKLKAKRLSHKTINRYLASVSKLLKFSLKRGYRDTAIDLPWQVEQEPAIAFLREDDERKLIDHMVSKGLTDYALMVTVLVQTGMRVSNLLRLRLADISPPLSGVVWITLGVTKSGQAHRVPLQEALGEPLRALIHSGLPSYRKFYSAFLQARKGSGIDPSITIHSLRHTTATRMTKAKVPTVTVQKMLGHRNIRTTLKYAHVEDESLVEAQVLAGLSAGQSGGNLAGQFAVVAVIDTNQDNQNGEVEQQDSGGLGGNRTPVQGFAVEHWWGS
jgi:integrase